MHGKTNSNNSNLPLDEDEDFDPDSRDVQPPFFGNFAGARAQPNIRQNALQWDGLKLSCNAYTLYKRAGSNLLKDVVTLFRKLPNDKYQEFIQVKNRQDAIANHAGQAAAMPGSSASFARQYANYQNGNPSGGNQGGNNQGNPFSSLFGSSAPNFGHQPPNPMAPVGPHVSTSTLSQFGSGKTFGSGASGFANKSSAQNIVTIARDKYTWIKKQFIGLITPVDGDQKGAPVVHKMLDFETGLPSVEAQDVYGQWSLLLEDVRNRFETYGPLDDNAILTISSTAAHYDAQSNYRLSAAFDSKVNFIQKVIFNVLHTVVAQFSKTPAKNPKFDEVLNWESLITVAPTVGQNPLNKIKREIQATITAEQQQLGNYKPLTNLLQIARTFIDSIQAIPYDPAPTQATQARFAALEAAVETANLQNEANNGRLSSTENKIILVFLRGTPTTLPVFTNNDAQDWKLAGAIAEEALTQEPESIRPLDKLILQQFIVQLLKSAAGANPNVFVRNTRSNANAGAPPAYDGAALVTEILKNADQFIPADQLDQLEVLAVKNKQSGAAKTRARRLAVQGNLNRRASSYSSDDDSDSEPEKKRKRRGGRSSKKCRKSDDNEFCRDVVEVLTMLYNMRLTKDFFTTLISNNIPVPISFDILQMYIRLHAGSTVFLKKGVQTGVMVINEAAMTFSRNPETFTVRVFARFACGTFIRELRNLEFVPHTYCVAYKGGAGLRFFDHSMHLQQFTMGNYPFDLLPIANSYNYKPVGNLFELTGSMHTGAYSGGEPGQWHYPTAEPYTNMLQLTRHQQRYPHIFSKNYFVEGNARYNTIASKSSQKVWEPSSTVGRGTISKLEPGSSALGHHVEPQDFDVLRGTSEFIGRGIEGSASRLNYRGRG